MPAAVAVPQNGALALIEDGEAEYERCGSLCWSLLIQRRVPTVIVAATPRAPALLARLPAWSFALLPDTEACLKDKRDYAFASETEARRSEFIRLGSVPIEYDLCLAKHAITLNTAAQTTLVDWRKNERRDAEIGFFDVGILRTSVPLGDGKVSVHQARYRAGRRWATPLFLSPYSGNAAIGARFAPTVATEYFAEKGFPDSLDARFWRLLQGSEHLGRRTAAWFDRVVPRGTLAR